MDFRILCSLSFLIVFAIGCGEKSETANETGDISDDSNMTQISNQIVDASCGECQFGLPGKGCNLAVRVDGKSYYVGGSSIDDFGDAHDEDGMCNCIRKARVSGEIKNGRFVSTSFELLPFDKEQHDANQQQALKKSRLGASLAMKGDSILFIKDIWDAGPAGKAGLKKDDVVSALNDKRVSDLDQETLKSILGDSPSIKFTVQRGDETIDINVDLETTK